jgi:hypothetical protein
MNETKMSVSAGATSGNACRATVAVREHDRHLDRYDRSADQTRGQQLGQVVDERSVPSAV